MQHALAWVCTCTATRKLCKTRTALLHGDDSARFLTQHWQRGTGGSLVNIAARERRIGGRSKARVDRVGQMIL